MTRRGRRACTGKQVQESCECPMLMSCRFMGAISRKLANFAGFYKGIQSAGAAIMWRLDGYKVPYMNLFISCWVLLAGSLVAALPVMLLKIKDTVPIEENLKFTDETLEDVIGYKDVYDVPELRRA
ncbi:hypothetical protein DE146DRAFT_441089 [Phaeosphaeria sp. MPI-PUGE-AT-0046c]|nr:hypothetical protein DE146DRAFT_441089 [Phaeosphaeria sp. MPI-PUGE-AT-0046c]